MQSSSPIVRRRARPLSTTGAGGVRAAAAVSLSGLQKQKNGYPKARRGVRFGLSLPKSEAFRYRVPLRAVGRGRLGLGTAPQPQTCQEK
jgi:hypothetical protein